MNRRDMVEEAGFRHELKYLVSSAELENLRVRIAHIMRPDPHADASGWYLIRSIYFDDLYNSAYRENEDGTSPREKWRIRAYNCSSERISLECKRKERGMIRKTACLISLHQMEQLVREEPVPVSDKNPPLLNRFSVIARTRRMRPACIVQYKRKPYICRNGNVRVTFDVNIASSERYDLFFDPALPARPVLPTGRQLLEVKYDEYFPDYIYHALQMRDQRQITFSKYYLCRRFMRK